MLSGLLFICMVSCKTDIQKPNIIYILADDLGIGDVSCFNNQSKIKTRYIDELASRGMRFTDAHSGSAVCTPTRYGILTGRYAWRTKLKQGVTWSWDTPLIDSNRLTVASFLKSQGYHTACIGKWHLGLGWQKDEDGLVDVRQELSESPVDNGFDYFFGIAASLDIPPYVYLENKQSTTQQIDTIEANGGKGFWRKGPIGGDVVMDQVLPDFTRKAVDFIQKQAHQGDPFFLYFPLPAPHTPILPLPEFEGKSQTNAYGDFVLMVDDVVRQIVEAVEAIGQLDNTIVIFTSDNGCSPMADFAELDSVGHHPSHIFRGHKADIFEGGHRIPFVVQWPAVIPQASEYRHTVCLTDLMSTCAAILQSDLPANSAEDSYNLLPAFQGESGAIREATVHHSINGSYAIRKDHWKLIFCPGSGGWSSPKPQEARDQNLPSLQLYNLQSDPGETSNVFDDHQDVVQDLTNLMEQYIQSGRSTPGTAQNNDVETELFYAQSKFN